MDEYIEKADIYAEIAKLEELARDRFVDTPFDSPARERYRAQMDARTEMKHLIADAQAADMAPVRHGRWLLEPTNPYDAPGYKNRMIKVCSCCHWSNACKYNYCPRCGAKMDGEA